MALCIRTDSPVRPEEYDWEYEEAKHEYELYHFPERFAELPEDVPWPNDDVEWPEVSPLPFRERGQMPCPGGELIRKYIGLAQGIGW
jgi:hypothetical protein